MVRAIAPICFLGFGCPSSAQGVDGPASIAKTKSSSSNRGHVTMWSTTNDALIGGACEFANPPVNSITDLVLSSKLRRGFHCAIGDSDPAFGQGEYCGKCFRITSLSDVGIHGTPGHAGSAVVTVSNAGAGGPHHFDCILDSFQAITGADSGDFDMEYEQVPCETDGNLVVINWAEENEWYCRMMFENVGHWGGVKSVEACLNGDQCAEMQRSGGATWTNCPQGKGNSMLFRITQESPDGQEDKFECNCPGPWPIPNGQRCDCGGNFGSSAVPFLASV